MTKEEMKHNAKPCPFCQGKNLNFTYDSERSFGAWEYKFARIICNDCKGAKGDGFGIGKPNEEYEIKMWQKWDERV